MPTLGAERLQSSVPGDDDSATPNGRSAPADTAYAVASCAFAGLLLVAAGLKADVAFNDPFARSHIGEAARHLLAAATEAAVAAWLLSGVAPAWARRAAIALLSVFVAVAGWHFLRGDADCGCFGRVRVHPGWTLAIDAAALTSLWYFGRGLNASRSSPATVSSRVRMARPNGVRIFLAVAAGLGVPGFTMLLASDPFKPRSEWEDSVAIDATLLDPRGWDGKPFPLLGELVPSDQDPAKGKWVVILVNHGCHKCEQYLASTDFDALRRTDGPEAPPRSLGVIELRADDSGGAAEAPRGATLIALRLRKGPVYLVGGPYEIYLSEGVVERTRRAY
jgi:hypothetical protein